MHMLQAVEQELDKKKKIKEYLETYGGNVEIIAKSNLCINDPRSNSFYGQEERPSDDCYCDNCFHQCHELGVIILEMLDLLKG